MMYSPTLSRRPDFSAFPRNDEYYSSLLDTTYETVMHEFQNEGEWTKEKPESGVSIWSRLQSGKSGVKAVRSQCRFRSPHSAEQFSAFVTNCTIDEELKERYFDPLEPNYDYYARLHTFTHAGDEKAGGLVHFVYNPHSWLISKRDFLIVRARRLARKEHWVREDCPTWVSYGTSIPASDTTAASSPYPIETGCVRATLSWSAWIVWKDDGEENENALNVVYFSSSDPAGSIPKGFYNRKLRERAMGVKRYVVTFLKYVDDVKLEVGVVDSGFGNEKNIMMMEMMEEEGGGGGGEVNTKKKTPSLRSDDDMEEEEGEVAVVVMAEEDEDEEAKKTKNVEEDALTSVVVSSSSVQPATANQEDNLSLLLESAQKKMQKLSQLMLSDANAGGTLARNQASLTKNVTELEKAVVAGMNRRQQVKVDDGSGSGSSGGDEKIAVELGGTLVKENKWVFLLALFLFVLYVLLQ